MSRSTYQFRNGDGPVPFNPLRLTIARQRRGLSKSQLAHALSLSVRTLQRWENAELEPTHENVATIATALGVPEQFMQGSDVEPVPALAVSFRAMSKLPARERDSALAAGRLGIELMEWVEARFTIPVPDVPTLPGWDPELAADTLRARWSQSDAKPIPKLLDLLELHGVRVLSLPGDMKNVDAFSLYWGGAPYMFLDTTKTGERLRFDAAHELGHLVLHCEHESPQGRDAELQAHRFAAALLMPRVGVLAAGLARAGVPQILAAKGRWRVAAMALAHRLRELNLLTEWGYRDVCVELSRLGYRKAEPGSAVVREQSQVLSKVLQTLRGKGMSPEKMAEDLGWTLTDLQGFMFGLTTMSQPTIAQGPFAGLQSAGRASRTHLRLAR